ncbi:hypothetical protein PybrP1_001410 [[Pythium] brassicae (nom. inval.)]|nr:hypothetical protein PybrP1_001410 [[Pythium] brassicae (nom. inval.)]
MFSLDAPLAPAIEAFVEPENDDGVHKTSLNTVVMQVHRRVSVEALIQALGPHLTSADDKRRARATQLLAEVLSRLPELPLTPNAVQLLLDFFADRLADFPSAAACLQALLALASNHARKLPGPAAMLALVQKMVQALHVPQLSQALRKKCFELMQLALAQPSVVAALVAAPAAAAAEDDDGYAFAQAFLDAMEGEKDPRNLLLCLQIARELLATLAPVFARHDQLLQHYFDVVSCYFPITFTPPPNDPYGITSEELIGSLRRAFAASDLLAKHAVPFLLEKLASTVVEAKLDALQTLVFCCEAYAVNALLLHMVPVANALYHEVVKGERKEVIEAALGAIARFAGVVGRAKTRAAGGAAYAWSKFVVELTARATSDLAGHAADSMVSVSAGRVLAALGRDSALGFAHVLDAAVPLLVQQFRESAASTASKCEASLARILLVVDTIDREVDQSAAAQPMRPHALVLIEALSGFLNSKGDGDGGCVGSTATAKCTAVQALAHLITFPPSPIVDPEHVKTLVGLFTRFLLLDPNPDVRAQCLESLREVSTIKQKATVALYAAFVMEIALARLMGAVKQDPASEGIRAVLASSHRAHDAFFQDALESVTQLSQQPAIFQATTVRLVDLCLCDVDGEPRVAGAHAERVLHAVAQIVELNADERASMEFCVAAAGESSLVFRLLAAVTNSAVDAARTDARLSIPVLAACARIFRTAMQNVSTESQQLLATAAAAAFLGTQSSSAGGAGAGAATPAAFLQLVPLFAAVINSASRNVTLPETPAVINALLELAQLGSGVSQLQLQLQSQSPAADAVAAEAALSAAKALASIVNKMPDGDEFDALIALLLERRLSGVVLDAQQALAVRVAALQIYAWVAKALVIRGHREHAPACLLFLCRFLTTPVRDNADNADDDAHMRMAVATSFKLLVTEYPDVLNRKCGALITFLYRQRMFDLVYPALVDHIRARSGAAAESVEALVALAYIVSHSPKAVYVPHLASIFPLMVQAINSDRAELGGPAIRTFKALLFESVESVKPFLKDVFPGLLKQAQRGPSALDRHDALECLSKLATIPYELIHPYKDTVLRQLLVCLDDRKRFVRHATVRVRNQWSIL